MTPAIMQWAVRNCVSAQALHELRGIFGMHGGHIMPARHTGTSEAAAQSVVRLEGARKGIPLFRNNVGVVTDETSIGMRFGLANDSKALNEKLKSGDLIGWRPRIITAADVGHTIGQFTSREAKEPGWRYTGTEREAAQLAWIMLLTYGGCDAAFATGEGTL